MIGRGRKEEWIHLGRSLLPGLILLGGLLPGCSRDPGEVAPPATDAEGTDYDPIRFDEGLLAIERWLEDGRPAEAEQIARRLVALNPDSIDALDAHGRCLVILAALERREGVGDGKALDLEALGCYRALIERSGETPLPIHLHAAGLAAQSAGELDEAFAFHVRADTIEPDNPQHAIFAGNILAGLGRTGEAKAWFEKATTIDPREPWGWAGLAEALRQDGATTDALEAIRKARSAAPGSSGFRVAEARILRESGNAREAAMLLYALPPLERATFVVTTEIALACEAIGEHRRAAEAWEALHMRDRDAYLPALNAAAAWLNAGEPELTVSWLDTAVAAGAPAEEVEAVRARLAER